MNSYVINHPQQCVCIQEPLRKINLDICTPHNRWKKIRFYSTRKFPCWFSFFFYAVDSSIFPSVQKENSYKPRVFFIIIVKKKFPSKSFIYFPSFFKKISIWMNLEEKIKNYSLIVSNDLNCQNHSHNKKKSTLHLFLIII